MLTNPRSYSISAPTTPPREISRPRASAVFKPVVIYAPTASISSLPSRDNPSINKPSRPTRTANFTPGIVKKRPRVCFRSTIPCLRTQRVAPLLSFLDSRYSTRCRQALQPDGTSWLIAIYSLAFYAVVIWSLLRNHDIMRVAFAQACAGYAHKARLLLHFRDSSTAGISHRLAQPSDHLVNQRPQHALVWNTRLDALGDQARLFEGITLEVAILTITALLHGGVRTQSPIAFLTLPLRDHALTRSFNDTRQQPAQTDR